MNRSDYVAIITPPVNEKYLPTASFTGIASYQAQSLTVTYHLQSGYTPNVSPIGVTVDVEGPAALQVNQVTALNADITFPLPAGVSTTVGSITIVTNLARPMTVVTSSATPLRSGSLVSSVGSTGIPPTSTYSLVDVTTTSSLSSPTKFTISTSSSSLGLGATSTSDSNSASTATPGSAQRSTTKDTAELAGIAIGCLVGGALIAGLLSYFFFRRRRGRFNRQSSILEKELSPLNGHGEAIYLAGGYEKEWEKQLPPTKSDSAIGNAARRMLDQIEMHVNSFYQDRQSIDLDIEAQSELEDLDSAHLPASVLTLIPQTKCPTLLIKHCIINFIVSRITPGGIRIGASFLPKQLAEMQTFSRCRRKHGVSSTYSENLPEATPLDIAGYDQALAQWRVLTSYLQQGFSRDDTYNTGRDQVIATAAQQVCRAFEPWARIDHDSRLQSITTIMRYASDIGIMLYSQQTLFEWRWETNDEVSMRPRDLVQIAVLPGLDKTTDQSAMLMTVGMHLLDPQIAMLDRV